ncbi:hypothetical protein AAG906_022129 [Vitis piasezkii]
MVKVVGLFVLYALLFYSANGKTHHHTFVVKSSSYTRLCTTKHILTVNGRFPGPTLRAQKGDKMIIKVYNKGEHNITLHWHGVKQPRNPWSDGPAYITQCPIQPRKKYTYRIHFTTEEGTMWWHAHLDWTRATVHGAIIIYPKRGSFTLSPPSWRGEWWKKDVMEIERNATIAGGGPLISDAYMINGQPGDLYPCSKPGTFKVTVEHGKRYLLRIVNAVMNDKLFFAIAKHKMKLVGTDGCYTKPLETNYIMITPGQSMDVLLEANRHPSLYYMAASSYFTIVDTEFDNTITTAILQYNGLYHRSPSPLMPHLPAHNQTQAATRFTKKLRSLASKDHPARVPLKVDTKLFITLSINLVNCSSKPCEGPYGKRFSASLNNISFITPSIDVLRAYYYGLDGVFDKDFPSKPPNAFNYTGNNLPQNLLTPDFRTKVTVLKYNARVELILQGTNVFEGDNHPFHLHGYSFYVVGWGFGNFNPRRDPLRFNLIDPPEQTTVGVPRNGWVAIRFRADNPGVWMMHCHIEDHQEWGMKSVFVVKDGANPQAQILPPPRDLPEC